MADEDGNREVEDCNSSEDLEEDVTINEKTPTVAADAPVKLKRKRTAMEQRNLSLARKRLFAIDLERPTLDTFCVENMKIDMKDKSTCLTQSELFARIFNALVELSRCKIKKDQPSYLALQVEQTGKRCAEMVRKNFEDFHLDITRAIVYVLTTVEGITLTKERLSDMVVQLSPVTCLIDESVRERLFVTGLEERTVNNSTSLSVNLSFDVKFLFVGNIVVHSRQDQGDKYYVIPTPCMGSYLNRAVNDLYELVYSRTREYVQTFFKRNPNDPTYTTVHTANDVYSEGEKRNLYGSGQKQTYNRETNDRKCLAYLLSAVGRDLSNLKKLDLDRTTVFTITSSANAKKPKFLETNTSDQSLTVKNTPNMDAEAVFLSSFTRARIMEDGSLKFNVYSRTCLYSSTDQSSPFTDGTVVAQQYPCY